MKKKYRWFGKKGGHHHHWLPGNQHFQEQRWRRQLLSDLHLILGNVLSKPFIHAVVNFLTSFFIMFFVKTPRWLNLPTNDFSLSNTPCQGTITGPLHSVCISEHRVTFLNLCQFLCETFLFFFSLFRLKRKWKRFEGHLVLFLSNESSMFSNYR